MRDNTEGKSQGGADLQKGTLDFLKKRAEFWHR
jgi:hypothetical protein